MSLTVVIETKLLVIKTLNQSNEDIRRPLEIVIENPVRYQAGWSVHLAASLNFLQCVVNSLLDLVWLVSSSLFKPNLENLERRREHEDGLGLWERLAEFLSSLNVNIK